MHTPVVLDTIRRRLVTVAMALTVTLVLALGTIAFAPPSVDARPIDGFGHNTCIWAGKEYGEGSVVKQGDGKHYRCRSGVWKKYYH